MYRTRRANHSEVLQTLVLFEYSAETRFDLGLLARILQIGPELLESIELTVVVVTQCLLFEIVVNVGPELLLKTVAVETK